MKNDADAFGGQEDEIAVAAAASAGAPLSTVELVQRLCSLSDGLRAARGPEGVVVREACQAMRQRLDLLEREKRRRARLEQQIAALCAELVSLRCDLAARDREREKAVLQELEGLREERLRLLARLEPLESELARLTEERQLDREALRALNCQNRALWQAVKRGDGGQAARAQRELGRQRRATLQHDRATRPVEWLQTSALVAALSVLVMGGVLWLRPEGVRSAVSSGGSAAARAADAIGEREPMVLVPAEAADLLPPMPAEADAEAGDPAPGQVVSPLASSTTQQSEQPERRAVGQSSSTEDSPAMRFESAPAGDLALSAAEEPAPLYDAASDDLLAMAAPTPDTSSQSERVAALAVDAASADSTSEATTEPAADNAVVPVALVSGNDTQSVTVPATGLPGQDAETLLGRAIAHLNAARPDAALTELKDLLLQSPQDPDALRLQGQAFLAMGQPDAAYVSLSRALELCGEDVEALRLRSRAAYRVGDWSSVVADAGAVLEQAPRDLECLVRRAHAHYCLDRLTEALQGYDAAVEAGVERADVYRMRGNIRYRSGDVVSALAEYDAALRLDPGDPDARFNRGLARLRAGDAAGACQDMDRVINASPRDAVAFLHRADARYLLERYDEALQDYDHALHLDASLVNAMVGRANVLCRSGRFEEAASAYDQALALVPESDVAWAGRAVCAALLGDLAGYEQALRQAELHAAPASAPVEARIHAEIERLTAMP